MAVRGINPLEKHVEKIFLALAAAGLTGVVAWQVAGGTGTIEVNKEQVQADQAYTKLESKAKVLQSQMREASPSTPESLKHAPDLRAEFSKRLTGDVAPSKQLAYQPKGVGFGPVKTGTVAAIDQYFLPPVLPPAVKPIAHPFMSTVHENDVTAYPELAKHMPAKAPYDKAAVSVETSIDPKAIRAALEADPDGSGPAQALLRNWWAGTEIVAVELVRQELKPDGTWGGEIATATLPGRRNFVAELNDPNIDTLRLGQITFDASTAIEEIARPEWYHRAELGGFVVGEEWRSPGQIAKEGSKGANGPLQDAQDDLKTANRELANLDTLIAKVRNGPAPKPPAGGAGAGGGGGGKRPGGSGGGGGIGGNPGGGAGTGQPKDPKAEQLKTLEKRREQVLKRIADLEKKIADLGGKAEDTAPKAGVKDADLGGLLAQTDPITVWHHDIEAVRGATYRYQVRVKLNNPLFNRGGQLKAEHVADAKSPTISVPCADWSDPVRVDDEVYCFITGANDGRGAATATGMGSAQVTLLYFTWGYWRGANISLEPGDGMIARWTVPDETKIAGAPAANAPQPPAVPGQGGGKRPGGAAAGGGGAPIAPAAPAAPALAALPTKEVTKERDAFLLDVIANPVSRSAGGGGPKLSFLALIRDIDKSIIARDPEVEKASVLYSRLEASVRAGREQLKGQGTAAPAGGNNPPGMPPGGPALPLNPGGRGAGGV